MDIEVLTESRSWRATPRDYNSLVFLRFQADCSGYICFGYGQTIFAQVHFRFVIPEQGKLELYYASSAGRPPYIPPFQPSGGRESKFIRYSLKQEVTQGIEANAGPFVCDWTLQLDETPFPEELVLPKLTALGHAESPPRTYFGHRRYLKLADVAE